MPLATQISASTMEPLSARIPSELYLWLAQLQVEGASTNSDKLRILLGQLKHQHDGAFDYPTAHAWARGLIGRAREALVIVEGQTGNHSEIVNLLLDHLTAALAMVISQVPGNQEEAAKFEEALVRRAFSMCETLLRQGATPHAAAYDPTVVLRHADATSALATHLQTQKGA